MASLPLPLLLFSISFSFFFFFFFFVFPLQAAVVTHLPGFQGALPFYLETGYVEVDEVNGGEYFYYFIRSESNPAEDPLLLWLTGGPRCSAFSGLIFEIGPLKFVTAEYNGSLPRLIYFPASWTKGYIIGNPATGEMIDYNSRVPCAHGMGIVSDNFFKSTQGSCKGQDHENPTSKQCALYLNAFNNFLSEINKAHILEPKCADEFTLWKSGNEDRRILKEKLNLLKLPPFPDRRCRSHAYTLSYYWINHHIVRKALYIKEGSVPQWVRCERNLPFTKDIKSSLKYQFNLLTRGYRALVYSGDHDMVVPFLGTQTWIKGLNSSVIEDWRSWHVDSQVAG